MTRRGREDDAPQHPAPGEAAPGVPFDPLALPDDLPPDPDEPPRAAPMPGTPLSDGELERLKSDAPTAPLPARVRGQPDPSAE